MGAGESFMQGSVFGRKHSGSGINRMIAHSSQSSAPKLIVALEKDEPFEYCGTFTSTKIFVQ
jgi:hypothetical protein